MPRYRHDLTEFVDFLRDWLAGYNLGEPGRYTRHLKREGYDSSRPDAYGCADAANILAMLGELPYDPTDRAAWVHSLQSFQQLDGVFVNASHSRCHTTAHVIAALELFDARPKHRLTFLIELADHDRLRGFLDELDWGSPWPASHDAAGVASALAITGEVGPDWFEAYFDWFDAEVDPQTGLWRRDRMLPVDEWPGLFANLGGSFHYHFVYDYLRQPWPAVEPLIDSCLILLYESAGRFALDGVGFAEMDLIFCLSRARRQTAYRFDEVGRALDLLVDRVVAVLTDQGYRDSAAFDDVHSTFGAVCAVAELQRAVPGSIRTPVPLRLVLDRRPFI